MAKILLIEDMEGVRTSIAMILTQAGHTVESCPDGSAGLQHAERNNYDLVISDILMPKIDGGEVIAALKSSKPATPIIAISGGGSGISVEDAFRIAREMADAVLPKPFSRNELLSAVEKLIPTGN